MGKIRLIGRLVGRDLRRRPGPALLLVLAITAATATLTSGLVLHGRGRGWLYRLPCG
jgi:putative ABC transport system permease protein